MDNEDLSNSLNFMAKSNASNGVFRRLLTSTWGRSKKATAGDVNKAMEKTKKRSKATIKAHLRQMRAFHIWSTGIADENQRSMITKYVDLLEVVSLIYNIEDTPATSIQALISAISIREKKIQELLQRNTKLHKTKIAVSGKYGLKCLQVLEIIDEIEENRSRLCITQQQISNIIELQLLDSLNQYHEWLTERAIQVQLASLDLKTHIKERDKTPDFRQSDKDLNPKNRPQAPRSDLQNAPATQGEPPASKKLDMGKIEDVSVLKLSEHGDVHGPPSPQSLILHKVRVPSIFEKAQMILGRVSKKNMKAPNSSSGPELEKQELKSGVSYDPGCSLDVEVSSPHELMAKLKQYSRRRKAWNSKIDTGEADKINKMELHNEWADADKADSVEEKLRERSECEERCLNPISSWNRSNWRF